MRLLLAAALFAGCASLEPVPSFHEARFRAVHLDTLAPARHDQFIAARQEWLAALQAAGRPPDGRGLFLELSDHRVWSLRPLRSMADLDRPREPDDPEGLKPARKKYDDASDEALVPPHGNEVWVREPDLDYPGADPALDELTAGASLVVVEQLLPSPPHGDAYEAAWAQMKSALQAKKYPLRRVSYWSRYGSGKLITFWLAHSEEELRATPAPELMVGPDVLAKWKGALASTETAYARYRRDLSGTVVP
ncbi:MAG TPA: hypothetical protein VFA20_01290 [Myxococcaceae bacterium]|nr:hypothetical protein [Myxococcaceae bacterium]